MNVSHDRDRQEDALRGKRIAIIGFGAQGQAHALNLHDGGYDVIVGVQPAGRSWARAQAAGLPVSAVPEAVRQADVAMMLIPDKEQPAIYEREVLPRLRAGVYLGFAQGRCVHFGRIVPPADTNVFLAAPRAPGRLVRQQYEAGAGVPCLIAVHQDASGDTREVARAYACGIGGGRSGVLQTTFREEAETALFGEQAVLSGGLSELIRRGFDTLVNNGYPPETAYFACLRELERITDLIDAGGITGLRAGVGNTAECGKLTRARPADRRFADAPSPADTQHAAARADGDESVNRELDWPGFDAAPSWYLRGRC